MAGKVGPANPGRDCRPGFGKQEAPFSNIARGTAQAARGPAGIPYQEDARHLLPLIDAVKLHGCALAIVPQHGPAFSLDTFGGRPAIFLVLDDMDESKGPVAFHANSLRAALRSCRMVSVIAAGALVIDYAAVTAVAVIGRRHAAIVECRSETEADWVAFIRDAAPDAGLFVRTVTAEGHA